MAFTNDTVLESINTIVKTLSTGIGLQLHWIQTSMFERHFELYSEKSLLAELLFEADGTAYGVMTIASLVTQPWTFKGTGILKPRLTIQESGENDDLAVYWPNRW